MLPPAKSEKEREKKQPVMSVINKHEINIKKEQEGKATLEE